MNDGVIQEQARRLDQLKAQGADGYDPVRFCYLAALTQRLQARPRVSQNVADRLTGAIDEFETRFTESQTRARKPQAEAQDSTPDPTGPTPLAALLHVLRAPDETASADEIPAGGSWQVPVPVGSLAVAPPRRELKALGELRALQARQTIEQLIEDAIARTPADAGPMNPHRLVTRALKQMRALSPEYARHFAGYVDTLLWLEYVGKKA